MTEVKMFDNVDFTKKGDYHEAKVEKSTYVDYMKEEGFSKDLLKKKEDADNKMILSGMNYIGKIGEEKGENCKINVFTGSGTGVTFKYEEEKEIRNLQTGTTDKVNGNVSVRLFKRRNKEMVTVYKEIRERVSKARK